MIKSLTLIASVLIASGHNDILYQNSITDSLQTAVIVADKGVVVSKQDQVLIQKTDDLPSIFNKIPSLFLNDNGSLSGLKQVSIRGMGAANTAIYIDGVRSNNAQSGQIDLGLIDQSSFSSMLVDYAQNSISFITARPEFADNKRFNLNTRFSAASFASYDAKASFEYKFNNKISSKANFTWLKSQGNFPYYTDNQLQTRTNNDVEKLSTGLDFFGNSNLGSWHAKAFYSMLNRGVPGSITFLDSNSRQKDKNAFLQFHLDNNITPQYHLSLSAKAAYDILDYLDSYGAYLYKQKDFQINSSHIYSIFDFWKTSLAIDVQYIDLQTNTEYAASRTSLQTALGSSLYFTRLSTNFAVLYNAYFDNQKYNRHCFSPSLDIKYKINNHIAITGFSRRSYRVPTFNELYYPGMSRTELKPEDSWLNDISFEYKTNNLQARISAFYYVLYNKITSMPDPNDPSGWTWLPYNIGVVDNKGIDISLSYVKKEGKFQYQLSTNYSFQNAIDKTPDSANFGLQIPYVPKHNLSAILNLHYQNWSLALQYCLKSGRFDSYGELSPWNTIDLSLSKKIKSINFFIKANNITNQHYEVVRNYPMPGISVTGGIELCF